MESEDGTRKLSRKGEMAKFREPYESVDLDTEFETVYQYSSSYLDDEVFLDFEMEKATVVTSKVKPRTRRVTDVIDSGEEPTEVRGRSLSDATGLSLISKEFYHLSPPGTPCSDLGYCSPTTKTVQEKWRIRTYPGRPTDSTDARPTTQESPQKKPSQLPVAKMPVSSESYRYNMSHPRRGYAVILNHELFSNKAPRTGSQEDVKRLFSLYDNLGFQVEIHNDLKVDQINHVIEDLANRDHSDCDCLVVTILTHGMQGGYLYAGDFLYQSNILWEPFMADNCLTLAGKPKIFIVQACRGDALDPGVRLTSCTETDSAPAGYKLPSMADFLFAYSTTEGYCSWRNPEYGTWFIESLCNVVGQEYLNMDLLRMMTRVCHKVAIEYESYNEFVMARHEQKQVPNIHSTLIRDVFFTPKNVA